MNITFNYYNREQEFDVVMNGKVLITLKYPPFEAALICAKLKHAYKKRNENAVFERNTYDSREVN